MGQDQFDQAARGPGHAQRRTARAVKFPVLPGRERCATRLVRCGTGQTDTGQRRSRALSGNAAQCGRDIVLNRYTLCQPPFPRAAVLRDS